MSETRKLLVTFEEGGTWLILNVHSLVTPDGQRWDARNGWTGVYDTTPEEVEANQTAAGKIGDGYRPDDDVPVYGPQSGEFYHPRSRRSETN